MLSDVQVVGGTLSASGGGSASGSYTVSQGDLWLSGETFVLQDGSLGHGGGNPEDETATTGRLLLGGSLLGGGTLSVPEGATATLDDLLWVDGGWTSGAGELRLLGENLVSAGTLGGNVSNQGTLQWTGGNFDGVVTNEGNLQIDGTAIRYLFGTLNNAGTVIHTATGPIRGYQNGVISNLAEGLYEFQQGVLQTWVGAPAFINAGVVRKTTDATATIGFSLDLRDGSDVQVVGGTLSASGGGSASGSYTVSQGDLRPTDGTFVLQDGSLGHWCWKPQAQRRHSFRSRRRNRHAGRTVVGRRRLDLRGR